MKTIKLEITDKRNDMVLLQETFTAKELFEDWTIEEQQAKTIKELKDAVKSRKDELFYWDNYKKDYFKKTRNYTTFLIKSDNFTRFVKFRNTDLKISIKQVKGGK